MNSTPGYMPHAAGTFKGGGQRRGKSRMNVIIGGNLRHMPDVHISDRAEIKRVIPDYDPKLTYTYRELNLIAEKILALDPKPPTEKPVILFSSQWMTRSKREIYVASGTPDPSINHGMYWRAHPNGRTINTDEQRKFNAASYYR